MLTCLIQIDDWLEPAGIKSQVLPQAGPSGTKPDDDTATEDSDNEGHLILKKSAFIMKSPIRSTAADQKEVVHSTSASDLPRETENPTKKSAASDSSPPPARPSASKKAKQAVSSSSDSDESDKVIPGPSTRRGARQPIKRGGKRF